jgi:hypothetical protein
MAPLIIQRMERPKLGKGRGLHKFLLVPGFSRAARVMAWICSKVRPVALDGGGLLGAFLVLSPADLLLSAMVTRGT